MRSAGAAGSPLPWWTVGIAAAEGRTDSRRHGEVPGPWARARVWRRAYRKYTEVQRGVNQATACIFLRCMEMARAGSAAAPWRRLFEWMQPSLTPVPGRRTPHGRPAGSSLCGSRSRACRACRACRAWRRSAVRPRSILLREKNPADGIPAGSASSARERLLRVELVRPEIPRRRTENRRGGPAQGDACGGTTGGGSDGVRQDVRIPGGDSAAGERTAIRVSGKEAAAAKPARRRRMRGRARHPPDRDP